MIYFDNAATTGKKPSTVIEAVAKSLKEYSANPGRSGHRLSVKTADAVYRVREKTAEFFGASGPEKVIFTLNCTHAINYVLKGVLKKGDHIIVSSMEHNAVMRPLINTGISYDIADVSLYDDSETVKNFENKIRPNTRMIFCTGASNVFGKMLPVADIGKLCRKRGILFGVDAAQISGIIPIDMQQMNIDFLCVAPHKGLYAPMGCGILISEKNIPNTLIQGGTGTNSRELVQPEFSPEKYESGTINVPVIIGASAAMDYVKNTGINKIYRHEMTLIKQLYSALKEDKNVILYTPEPMLGSYAPVLSFNYTGTDSISFSEKLSDYGVAVRGGLHCAPIAHEYMGTIEKGTVRVSPAAFNTPQEINTLLRLFKNEKNFKK